MKYVIFGLIGVGILAGVVSTYLSREGDEIVACTMDAMLCPDGSYVGRTGPSCEFKCGEVTPPPDDIQAHIDEKSDLIKVTVPAPGAVIANPMTITGEARGQWFFEASFPIMITDWDGKVLAETSASAQGDWMTTEFVPFVAELGFESPYKEGDPDFMKRGTLILKKDNPSGLPEHDNAIEIPVQFAP